MKKLTIDDSKFDLIVQKFINNELSPKERENFLQKLSLSHSSREIFCNWIRILRPIADKETSLNEL